MNKRYFDGIYNIRKYIGDMSQVAGIKSYKYLDGKSNGVRAVDFWTGTGLSFTVLLDRCMDIPQASHNGRSLCWRSSAKEVHPFLYDSQGFGWVKGFFGGLLTTCGLTYLGAPCIDQGISLGLHGNISYIPAEDIKICQEWQGSEYVLSVAGTVRQVSVFGECLILTRKITAWFDKSEILIEDKVDNVSFKGSPFMILYHINIGFPLLSPGSRFISQSRKITPRDEEAENGIENFDSFQEPVKVYKEKVYYHDMKEDKRNYVKCAVLSNEADEPFGLYLIYNKRELPQFVQWKMLENQNFVLGIEPSNCWTEGRDKEREWDTLDFIKPGESRFFSLRFGIFTDKNEIKRFVADIKNIIEGKRTQIISRSEMIKIKKSFKK
jgi:hypothetical protein